MTPQFIIEVARAMAAKADKIHDTCAISNRIEEIRCYQGWAGNNGPDNPIVVGNWNNVDVYDPQSYQNSDGSVSRYSRRAISNIPSRLCRIFEKMKIDVEWSDMVSPCDNCGLLVATEPDCYGWTPGYKIVNECEFLCLDCCEDS